MTTTANKRLLTGEHRAGGTILPFWRAVFEIARKDVLIYARTKRLYIFGGVFTVGLLAVSIFFASIITEIVDAGGGDFLGTLGISGANAVMAFALALPVLGAAFWLFALGIVFSFDAVVREYEDKSLFLILSKPVSREAFVLGKFAGAVFSVASIFLVVCTISYFVVQMVLGQAASADDYGRFYLALVMVITGLVAISSLALFMSAVTRSTVTSIVASLSIWIIGLNVLSSVGTFYAFYSQDITADHWLVKVLQYVNPTMSIGPAMQVLLNFRDLDPDVRLSFGAVVGGLGLDPVISQVSLLGFAAVFVGATLWAVNKRNFE